MADAQPLHADRGSRQHRPAPAKGCAACQIRLEPASTAALSAPSRSPRVRALCCGQARSRASASPRSKAAREATCGWWPSARRRGRACPLPARTHILPRHPNPTLRRARATASHRHGQSVADAPVFIIGDKVVVVVATEAMVVAVVMVEVTLKMSGAVMVVAVGAPNDTGKSRANN